MTTDELCIHRVAVLAQMAATLEAGDRARIGYCDINVREYAERAELLYKHAEIAALRLEPAP